MAVSVPPVFFLSLSSLCFTSVGQKRATTPELSFRGEPTQKKKKGRQRRSKRICVCMGVGVYKPLSFLQPRKNTKMHSALQQWAEKKKKSDSQGAARKEKTGKTINGTEQYKSSALAKEDWLRCSENDEANEKKVSMQNETKAESTTFSRINASIASLQTENDTVPFFLFLPHRWYKTKIRRKQK